jgi:hypothetical protein
MSRQLEAAAEVREEKRRSRILWAVEGGLSEAVGRAGGQYRGFASRESGVECLLVIKAEFPAGPQVAFVGSADLGSALIKAVHDGERDLLRWRADEYASKG